MKLDILIPTYGGETTIEDCLIHAFEAINASEFKVNRLIVDWKPTEGHDFTQTHIMAICERLHIPYVIYKNDHNLPEARQFLMEKTETDWFLFLDDDVMLTETAAQRLYDGVADTTGAIQVRRVSDSSTPAKWCQWRPVRGTTFATLIQQNAIKDIDIPHDVTVVEDQFIREYIENHGYNWVFDPYATFSHHSQHRHEIDWKEGFVAGKYELVPLWYIFGNVGFNPLSWKHYERALGYIYGRWFQ